MASKVASFLLLALLAAFLRSLSSTFLGATAPRNGTGAPGPAARHRAALRAEDDDDEPGFSWEGEKPDLPTSPAEMAQQAADAVMRAYRDGKTRQAMRLRLDELFDMESIYVKGIQSLQLATAPFMEAMSKKFWGGEFLKDVKTSVVDDQESDNEFQDIAMFYLPGRDLMADQKTQNFLRKMKDRLVLLVNPENAQAFWRPDYQGMDWGDYTNMGKEMSNMFREQTYYYDKAPFQSWQMTTFRAYPYNWETEIRAQLGVVKMFINPVMIIRIYIEDLDYNLVKIFDSDYKPTSNQIVARLEQYEQKNAIPAYKKMAKIMKDTMKQEEASEEVEPGWRSSATPEEMVKRQEESIQRAKEEAAKWDQKEKEGV